MSHLMNKRETGSERSLGERLKAAELHPGEQWLGNWPIKRSNLETRGGRSMSIINMPSVDEQIAVYKESGLYATVRKIPAYSSDGNVRPYHAGIVVKYKERHAQH